MERSITGDFIGHATCSGGCPKCGGQMIMNSKYVECAERHCEYIERLTSHAEWDSIRLQRSGYLQTKSALTTPTDNKGDAK